MSYFSEIVNKKDNRNAILLSILAAIFIVFVLFFMKFHEPNPPIVDIPLPMEMENTDGIEAFEVDNGGGGAPTNNDNPEETPQEDPAKEQPQQEKSPVEQASSNGSSSSNNTSNSNTNSENSNPFSNGSGGNGTDGNGTGFGSDDGPGTGAGAPGRGGSGDRVRLSDINSKPKTPNNVASTIALKLTVNADGRVTSVKVIRQNTSTSNEALINEVIKLTKKEVKYKPKPGSIQETCYYTVNLRPN